MPENPYQPTNVASSGRDRAPSLSALGSRGRGEIVHAPRDDHALVVIHPEVGKILFRKGQFKGGFIVRVITSGGVTGKLFAGGRDFVGSHSPLAVPDPNRADELYAFGVVLFRVLPDADLRQPQRRFVVGFTSWFDSCAAGFPLFEQVVEGILFNDGIPNRLQCLSSSNEDWLALRFDDDHPLDALRSFRSGILNLGPHPKKTRLALRVLVVNA